MSGVGGSRGSFVLDAGAVLALARGNAAARAATILGSRRGMTVVVPTAVVAQVIRGVPGDAAINRILNEVDEFVTLSLPIARRAGALLRASGTTDVVDAVVAVAALQAVPSVILTSAPDDLRALVMSDPAHARVQVVAV